MNTDNQQTERESKRAGGNPEGGREMERGGKKKM